MKRRFDECAPEQKLILRVIKKIYLCEFHEEHDKYSLELIKMVAKEDEFEAKPYEWDELLEGLEDLEFLTQEVEGITMEEVYLERVIQLRKGNSLKKICRKISELLSENTEDSSKSEKSTLSKIFDKIRRGKSKPEEDDQKEPEEEQTDPEDEIG